VLAVETVQTTRPKNGRRRHIWQHRVRSPQFASCKTFDRLDRSRMAHISVELVMILARLKTIMIRHEFVRTKSRGLCRPQTRLFQFSFASHAMMRESWPLFWLCCIFTNSHLPIINIHCVSRDTLRRRHAWLILSILRHTPRFSSESIQPKDTARLFRAV
jgi:hypothetical protein